MTRPTTPAGSARTWPLVASREVVVKLTDRNFLISTVLTLMLIVGMLVFQGFMASRESTSTIAVTSSESGRIVQRSQDLARQREERATLTAVTTSSEADARTSVQNEAVDAWLHRGPTGEWVLTSKAAPSEELTQRISEVVRDEALTRNAAAANTTLEALQRGSQIRTDRLDAATDETGPAVRLIAGLLFAMLFYVASLLFGMAIAQSVVEEKQSRIVEILATAIPVRQLLIGKVVGNTLLALAQMLLFVGATLIGVSFTEYKRYLPSLSGPAGWYLLFFLAGFVTLACVWAVAGALASRVEDLQSTTTPLTIVLVVALFAGLSATGTLLVVASYIPLLSTITMPMRLLAGEAAWWEPIVSLVVTLVAAGLVVRVAETIYRRSLLQTQGRVTVRQALATGD
ncbi:MAG TPA: ABC transporter permease [Dermatophilaceae bacterium]|nr:ABC transporter permease [Dermatophilaceae bacterium]